jgi:TonB family protein
MIPTNGMVVGWVVCILMLLPPLAIGKDKKQQEAEALLAKARELSDIRAEGSPAFRLQARVRIVDSFQAELPGTYVLVWSSPRMWHEELVLPGYTELRVRVGDKIWVKRPLIFCPWRVRQLRSALDFQLRLKMTAGEKADRLEEHEQGGARIQCLVLKTKGLPLRTLCFDPTTNAFLRDETPFLAYEYSDHFRWGRTIYPRNARVLEGGTPVVKVEVEDLTSQPVSDTASFAPLSGDGVEETCETPQPPKALRVREAPYPESGRAAAISGTVLLFVLVGKDGTVRHADVFRSLRHDFDAASLETVKQWRFHPAMCSGVPVEFGILVEMHFKLR